MFEAVVKVLAEGDDPLAYFRTSYRDIVTGNDTPEQGGQPEYMNIFDFSVLVIGLVTSYLQNQGEHDLLHDYANIKLIKLVRILRLFSVANSFESLRLVMMGLLQGMRSSFYIVVLLVLVIYMFGVLAVRIFGANGWLFVPSFVLFKWYQ